MAYQIDRYNNTPITVVEDGTVDQTTDLKFIGKNYAGYGEIQNENFLFLLENFSSANEPPKAISGQIWYDSGSSKLKFYDGTKFRTTGGAEVSATAPTGLTIGDFWWDTANEQLYALGSGGYVLVGPQGTAGNITQMVTRQVRDVLAVNHNVMIAYAENNPIYTVSADSFEIDSSDQENSIPGFTHIKQGLTLVNTNYQTGVTTTGHRYWGTAADSDRLGGFEAADYIRAGTAAFTGIAEFTDDGIAIGDGLDLKIYIENDNQGVIQNAVGNNNLIKFKANNQSGTAVHSITIQSTGINPASSSAFNLGTSVLKWSNVYADNFVGVATVAGGLTPDSGTTTYLPSINSGINTVALRDGSGNLTANFFNGISTGAKYADLAEKYTTEAEYSVGTVVAVCEHEEHEMALATPASVVAGVISEKPAFLMNAEAQGQAVALKGRVPVRILGAVKKGDKVFVAQDGLASTEGQGELVGIALESSSDISEKLVECFLKV